MYCNVLYCKKQKHKQQKMKTTTKKCVAFNGDSVCFANVRLFFKKG